MRVNYFTAPAVLLAWMLVSCTKENYRPYTCRCVQESKGDILDTKEYGVHATSLGEAGMFCNDIEDRVNESNEAAGISEDFNCRIK